MDVEDTELYIKHLAYFVRTHEKALANSLNVRPSTAPSSHSRHGSSASLPSASEPSVSSSGSSLFSLASIGFGSKSVKPAKLFLTPNQLYYLLTRFEELGVSIGPMNVRLEDILAESTSSNYMSFMAEPFKPQRRTSDQGSIHSVSSVRSVMSSMSSMWSKFGLSDRSAAKADKAKAALMEDIRYLYSAFTKIPSLKLAVDPRIRRIAGFEEFPFDTAVPVYVFKNVTNLEIMDTDFRSFSGWDRLADQLRSLTVKRACVEDPADLLTNIVLDDMDGRRWRSSKNATFPASTIMPSPRSKFAELSRSSSIGDSPFAYHRRQSVDLLSDNNPYGFPSRGPVNPRMLSNSPTRPIPARKGSLKPSKSTKTRPRRSSDSSNSTGTPTPSTPRTSSSNLLLSAGLPASKWRFLRHLSLADNGLTSINAESLSPVAQTLHSLDLSANLFVEVPENLAVLTSLRALNLSNCLIDSLRSLTKNPLPAIAVLSLRGNRLSTLVGAERLMSLERIDVRDNLLTDPVELARLSGIPGVRDVYVARNPFSKVQINYRVMIFNVFRLAPGREEDVTIDAIGPTSKERRELIDRAPEPQQVPVIAAPMKDEIDDVAMAMPAPPLPARVTQQAMVEDEGAGSRSKTPKRRVVDVEHGATSPQSDYTPTKVAPTKPTVRTVESKERSPEVTPTSPTQTTPRKLDLRETNEAYKQRIQALQLEHGNGWLGHLGAEHPQQALAVGTAHVV